MATDPELFAIGMSIFIGSFLIIDNYKGIKEKFSKNKGSTKSLDNLKELRENTSFLRNNSNNYKSISMDEQKYLENADKILPFYKKLNDQTMENIRKNKGWSF